jgi:hypothetical protein
MGTVRNLEDFRALEPFFDILAEDAVFEYVITVPGYLRRVVGRDSVAELYRPYGTTFALSRCYDLRVHHDQRTSVVVLEYSSEGGPSVTRYARMYRSTWGGRGLYTSELARRGWEAVGIDDGPAWGRSTSRRQIYRSVLRSTILRQ